jgi:hypothetical protein
MFSLSNENEKRSYDVSSENAQIAYQPSLEHDTKCAFDAADVLNIKNYSVDKIISLHRVIQRNILCAKKIIIRKAISI